MSIAIYPITAMGKPRMTQADKWKTRAVVLRYRAFKDECRLRKVHVPDSGAHITFILPMPKSWSITKREEFCGTGHQSRPDKDNLEKALNDAVFGEDSHIWDNRITKRWGIKGKIIIESDALEVQERINYG